MLYCSLDKVNRGFLNDIEEFIFSESASEGA
jgi:hypothetical protein